MAVLQASVTGETLDDHTVPRQVITGFSTGGLVAANGWAQPYYLDDAKMSHIVQVDTAGVTSEDAGKGWQDQLSQVASVSAGADLVAAVLGSKLAKQMMVAAEDIDLSKPVSAYGVDSLTAVEIRAWSFRDLQADISIFDIMSNVPISGLARTIVTKSKFIPKQLIEADN
jgi:Phosphopantetheine attachment site